MKKVLSILLSVFIISTSIFAQNNQKIWHVDSDVYKYMTYLYVSEGHALPNSVGPWSTDELKKMLTRIGEDSSNLQNPNSIQIYETIYSILYAPTRFTTSDDFHFDLKGTFTPELYVHSNAEDFNQESDWNYNFQKRNKLLRLEGAAYTGENFYFYINLGLGYSSYIQKNESVANPIFSPVFMSNIPFIPLKDATYLDANFPDRAFTSIGGNHWSLSAGRDIIRWGNGETGNLFLGGNAPYDNYFRFSTYYNNFKFTFLGNVYPHDQNYNSSNQNTSVDGIKLYLAHRFDFRFLKDKICLSASESIMYQSASNTLDVRYLNPTTLFHSFFIRGNANSLMSVELDYTPINRLNFYTQFAMDDMPALGEPATESETGGHTSKMGYMLGTKFVQPLNFGVLKLSLEGVYCDPCLYLREKYDSETQTQGVSLYGYTKEFRNHDGVQYLRNCVGYKYGGDCIVGDFKATLDTLGKWKTGFEGFYMAHGIMYNDLNNDWMFGKQARTPSTTDQQTDENGNPTPTNNDGSVEHLLRFSINQSYQFFDWLGVSGGIDNWFIWNKNNLQRPMVYDFQLYTGVTITF